MKLSLDIDDFLQHYWQQRPLLIRNAIDDFVPPIDANELAGLAMEEEVESRIVESQENKWSLHHGPFIEDDFSRDHPWTLLVQSVDHYVQEVADLLKLVNFIPSWRVDDVMVSYAVDGGSVGPHYDNYDVFLLQGEGNRKWRLGQKCDSSEEMLDNTELRLLDNFRCKQEYILGPGDILYVPPGVAHWGIAEGECTTFSLGFRAPRVNDMLSRQVDAALEQLDEETLYTDPGRQKALRAGEICDEDIQRVKQQLRAALESAASPQWFGEMLTEPTHIQEYDEEALGLPKELTEASMSEVRLFSDTKLAWRDCAGHVEVYANGESCQFPVQVLPSLITLCTDHTLHGKALIEASACDATRSLLEYLFNTACISIE